MESSPRAQAFGAPHSCANCGGPFTPAIAGQTLCDRCQGLAQPEPKSPLQETEVAGFKLLHELGAGRFSHSWLAEDAQGSAAVLKLLRRYAPDPNSVQRFLAEAQRLCGAPELAHPAIARPLTAGVHLVSAFFLVYQSGGDFTLADELRQRGRLMPGRALELCAQVCDGLSTLHGLQLLHLDLKPANVGVMRREDGTEQAVLLDACTSHLLAHVGLREASPPMLPLSSAAYMSPEEARGAKPDARSDLYSVGVLLFQLVSGRLPFAAGPSADEHLKAHRDQAPLRLRDVGRRLHGELEDLIARLLAKNPEQRPHSGEEVAVVMRALAPVADAPPMEEGSEAVEDPVPVVALPPEVASVPQRLQPSVDPALERAMMGEVTPSPDFGRWRAFVAPRWWPVLASAAAVALVAIFFARRHAVPAPRPAATAVVQSAPAPRAAKPAAAPAAPLAAPAAVPAPETARAPEAPPPRKNASATSSFNKTFDRAQKLLWTKDTRMAEALLTDLLRRRGLSRRDRARASKMMGEAETQLGNKAKAAKWYRKSFKLYDDPQERAKVARLMGSK